jgi:hypothetical protein
VRYSFSGAGLNVGAIPVTVVGVFGFADVD